MTAVALALVLAVSGVEGTADLPAILRQEAAVLEQQRETLQGVAEADVPRRVRETLSGLRKRLLGHGLDEGFAGALVPAGGVVSDSRSAKGALTVLTLTRRKLLKVAEAAERETPPGPPAAGALLAEILEDPVFADRDTGANVIRRMIAAVNRALLPLIEGLTTAFARHGRLAVFIAVGVLVVTLVWVIVRLFPAAGPRSLRRRAAPIAPVFPAHRRQDAEQLLAAARAAVAAGDGIQGLRQAQLAAVVALRARDLLPATPGLTDFEGARLLAARRDETGERFGQLARLHDRAVFGGHAPDPPTARTALDLAGALVQPPASGSGG